MVKVGVSLEMIKIRYNRPNSGRSGQQLARFHTNMQVYASKSTNLTKSVILTLSKCALLLQKKIAFPTFLRCLRRRFPRTSLFVCEIVFSLSRVVTLLRKSEESIGIHVMRTPCVSTGRYGSPTGCSHD